MFYKPDKEEKSLLNISETLILLTTESNGLTVTIVFFSFYNPELKYWNNTVKNVTQMLSIF